MPKMGKMSISDLKNLQTQLTKIQNTDMDVFAESCAKELAECLLSKVIPRTPVGKNTGKNGGTLRSGWTVQSIRKEGNVYKVDIVNPVKYAPYVEYGHRTVKKNGFGWTPGHFMLTISEQEIQNISPRLLEAKITQFLKGAVQ